MLYPGWAVAAGLDTGTGSLSRPRHSSRSPAEAQLAPLAELDTAAEALLKPNWLP